MIFGLIIMVVAFYLFLSEFFKRDADLMFTASATRYEKHCPSAGNGRLREWRGPLYWTGWLIRQW